MISDKDMEILGHLRKNSREKITEISRTMNVPVTTVYDKIRAQHKKGILKKHTSLVDFSKLGYNAKAIIAFKVRSDRIHEFQEFLESLPNTNSLYRINSTHDFLVEVIFPGLMELQMFLDETQKYSIEEPKIFNILHEIKREVFLNSGGKNVLDIC